MRAIALFQALLFLTLGIFEGTPWHRCPHHDGQLIVARMHASAHGRDTIRAVGMAGMVAQHPGHPSHDSHAPAHRGCTCIGCSCCGGGILASCAPAAPTAPLAEASPERPTAWTFPALRAGYLELLPDSTAPPLAA